MVGAMQPISALQQLTSLLFTCCGYGIEKSDRQSQLMQTAELPAAALAELIHLVALDASGCRPLPATGALQDTLMSPEHDLMAEGRPTGRNWCWCPPNHVLLSRAGLQKLAALQQLEVLRVPCDDAQAITRLAAQLPRLRSLDLRCCPLRCCSPKEIHLEAAAALDLTAAAALTQLRLHMCGGAFDTVQRMQMPPQLQVLRQGALLCLCPTGLLTIKLTCI